ncbi:MAG: transcription termination/antitermination protein NusG [Candidatus Rokuibacteriota bacterium]
MSAVDRDLRAVSFPDEGRGELGWYALWTNSRCEQLVHDQLRARSFDPFLPKVNVWSRRGDERHLVSRPLFSGYLFLRHPRMDKTSYVELCKARGLVRVLGERWDQLHVVPDGEIDAIRRALDSRLPVTRHPYLREGQRVRIVGGPLTDLEGILVRTRLNKGLVVLNVNLLQRGVAVEVDCTRVTPV